MLPDRVSNPGPLTYESGPLSIALRGPAYAHVIRYFSCDSNHLENIQGNVPYHVHTAETYKPAHDFVANSRV